MVFVVAAPNTSIADTSTEDTANSTLEEEQISEQNSEGANQSGPQLEEGNIEQEVQHTVEMEAAHEEAETKPEFHEQVHIKQEPGVKSEPPFQDKYGYEANVKVENSIVSL